jgi:hypothetical protein
MPFLYSDFEALEEMFNNDVNNKKFSESIKIQMQVRFILIKAIMAIAVMD